MQDLQTQLSQIDKNAESKLANLNSEHQLVKNQLREIHGQNADLRSQVTKFGLDTSQHETMMKKKDQELLVMKADLKRHEDEKFALKQENDSWSNRHGEVQARHRSLEGEVEGMRTQRAKMEREASEVRRHLESIMPFFSEYFR